MWQAESIVAPCYYLLLATCRCKHLNVFLMLLPEKLLANFYTTFGSSFVSPSLSPSLSLSLSLSVGIFISTFLLLSPGMLFRHSLTHTHMHSEAVTHTSPWHALARISMQHILRYYVAGHSSGAFSSTENCFKFSNGIS